MKDSIGDYSVTFFVTNKGEAIFIGASEQMTDSNHAWIYSRINYIHQDSLQDKFGPLIKRTAAWLAAHGYYGPGGIDILETTTTWQTNSHTGEETAHLIVALNVRTSGSTCLPVVRGHFTRLGLRCASSSSITVKGSRQEFMDEFREDFGSGRMCILGWYHDVGSNVSNAYVVVSGSDEADMQGRVKKVRDVTEEVIFRAKID